VAVQICYASPWRDGPGGFSLRQSSGWVSLLEIAELSHPGVHWRLNQAVAFLAALVMQLLASADSNASRPPVTI
jgi:hypothetical protein